MELAVSTGGSLTFLVGHSAGQVGHVCMKDAGVLVAGQFVLSLSCEKEKEAKS